MSPHSLEWFEAGRQDIQHANKFQRIEAGDVRIVREQLPLELYIVNRNTMDEYDRM